MAADMCRLCRAHRASIGMHAAIGLSLFGALKSRAA